MVSQFSDKVIGYRIADSRHSIYSGEGAQKIGGRWNSIGVKAIYAAANLSGAILEVRVHLNQLPLPQTYKYIKISSAMPIKLEKVEKRDCKTWDINDQTESQSYGSCWLKELRTVILYVPSLIIPLEYNLVINPCHPDFKKLKITQPQSMDWDPRLF